MAMYGLRGSPTSGLTLPTAIGLIPTTGGTGFPIMIGDGRRFTMAAGTTTATWADGSGCPIIPGALHG